MAEKELDRSLFTVLACIQIHIGMSLELFFPFIKKLAVYVHNLILLSSIFSSIKRI